MQAVVCEKYGTSDNLIVKEVSRPTPKKDEVCIKIHVSAVTESDLLMRGAFLQLPLKYQVPMRIMFGILKPRQQILGFVLAGEVVQIGRNVKRFKVGDEVYGLTGFGKGAYAEYKCMRVRDSLYGCLNKKPINLTLDEATVAIYGGVLAFQFLSKMNIGSEDRLLIYGASGTCGTMAIQIAKSMGAETHAVCSGKNKRIVEGLGADKVYDYTKDDSIDQGIQFDFILDAVGKRKVSKLKENLRKNLKTTGQYVSIDDEMLKMDSDLLGSLTEMIEKNRYDIIVDKIFSIVDIKEAHDYVEKGHKTGGVVVRIVDNNSEQ